MSLNLSEINKSIDFFQYIYTYFGKLECIELYGDKLGKHIWKIKEKYQHKEILWDVEHFFEDLDVMNKKVLIDWYNKKNKSKDDITEEELCKLLQREDSYTEWDENYSPYND